MKNFACKIIKHKILAIIAFTLLYFLGSTFYAFGRGVLFWDYMSAFLIIYFALLIFLSALVLILAGKKEEFDKFRKE